VLGRSFPAGSINLWANSPESGTLWFRYTNPNGERGYTLHVQSDSYGNIEYYAENDDVVFRILGYYNPDVAFTEDWSSVTGGSSNWAQVALTAPANRVVELVSLGYNEQVGVAWGRGYPGDASTDTSPQGWIVQEGGFVDNPVGSATATYPVGGKNAATWLTATDASQRVYLRNYSATLFYLSGYFHNDMKLLQPTLTEGLLTDSVAAWKSIRLSSYERIQMGFKEYGCNYVDYWGTTGGATNNILMGPVVALMWHGEDQCAQPVGVRARGSFVDRRISLAARQLGGSSTPASSLRISELNTKKGNAICSFLTQPDEEGYFSYYQQSPYYSASTDTWKQPVYGAYIRITGIIYWQWYGAAPTPETTPEVFRTPQDMEAV